MAEATWGDDTQNPPIDWKASAALEDIVRNGEHVPEVTNLERAVREWTALESAHRAGAVLTLEHPVTIDGVEHHRLTADGIQMLAAKLPA